MILSSKVGILTTFGLSRWNDMVLAEKYLVLFIYFNLDGTVKEVWFLLRKDTQITPSELLTIENNIKSHTFVLDNADCIGIAPFHRMNVVFRFE